VSGAIVVKVGGTTLEDRATARVLFGAISALHRAHAPGVVLVHGGGKAVDQHLDRLGLTSERREGIRITPPDQIAEIAGVLAGRINKSVVGRFLAEGVPAVGLCLGDGNAVPTRKAGRFSFDPGRVGEVIAPGSGSGLLDLLLSHRYLPVLCSIGLDALGEFLNVNADDAAAGLAPMIGASLLVLMTDVPGILDGNRRLVRELSRDGIEAMIASGEISGGMIVKARAAAEAARASGTPVLIMAGNDPSVISSLAALPSGQPTGTRILPAP
jgi:acetylglutamate kinase